MITGIVTKSLEATVWLTVIGPGGNQQEIDALVDTGFDGWLSLPASIISKLKLPWRGRGRALLADGSETVFDLYEATMLWHQESRRIRVDEAETEPLIGIALLEGSKLNIEVREGGRVIIELLE